MSRSTPPTNRVTAHSQRRWASVDPLAEAAPGWTPYRYGFDNPIRYSHPTGMIEESELKHLRGQMTGEISVGQVTVDGYFMSAHPFKGNLGFTVDMSIVKHEIALDLFGGKAQYGSHLLQGQGRVGSQGIGHLFPSSLKLQTSARFGFVGVQAWVEYNYTKTV